jgi:uncharacterized protein with ParB-like and HNH nuclease domain
MSLDIANGKFIGTTITSEEKDKLSGNIVDNSQILTTENLANLDISKAISPSKDISVFPKLDYELQSSNRNHVSDLNSFSQSGLTLSKTGVSQNFTNL